jgi:hypothetical protein
MASIRDGFARAGAVALIAALTFSVAHAAGPQPVPRNQAPPLRPASGPCDSYGAGYVRVAGSDTCIKTGASVTTDAYSAGSSSSASGSAIAPALRSK